MRALRIVPLPALLALLALVGAESRAAAEPKLLQDCPACPKLVIVPAGRFVMGSDDGEKNRSEGPMHAVRLRRAFALAQTEVTVADFRRFIAATGYVVAPGCRVQEREPGPRGRIEWRDDPARGWQDPGFISALREDQPVVCVGRVDALAYVAWLTAQTGHHYRLPSEAEWEYAARARSTGAYSWGNNPDNACEFANLYDRIAHRALDFGWGFADCDDGHAELAPVASLRPNAFGLHDMIGNVWEWTQDCYRLTYDHTPRDGSAEPAAADCTLWSVRGGAWMTRPGRNRLTFRGRDPNDARYSYFGFRVARDLERAEARAH